MSERRLPPQEIRQFLANVAGIITDEVTRRRFEQLAPRVFQPGEYYYPDQLNEGTRRMLISLGVVIQDESQPTQLTAGGSPENGQQIREYQLAVDQVFAEMQVKAGDIRNSRLTTIEGPISQTKFSEKGVQDTRWRITRSRTGNFYYSFISEAAFYRVRGGPIDEGMVMNIALVTLNQFDTIKKSEAGLAFIRSGLSVSVVADPDLATFARNAKRGDVGRTRLLLEGLPSMSTMMDREKDGFMLLNGDVSQQQFRLRFNAFSAIRNTILGQLDALNPRH